MHTILHHTVCSLVSSEGMPCNIMTTITNNALMSSVGNVTDIIVIMTTNNETCLWSFMTKMACNRVPMIMNHAYEFMVPHQIGAIGVFLFLRQNHLAGGKKRSFNITNNRRHANLKQSHIHQLSVSRHICWPKVFRNTRSHDVFCERNKSHTAWLLYCLFKGIPLKKIHSVKVDVVVLG